MVEAVARHGYERVRIAELVGLAGISKRDFYESFASKEECFLATFEEIIEQATTQVRGAYRAGAGLVRLAVPESLQPLVAGRVAEATTVGLPETDVAGEVDAQEALDRLLDLDHDAAVVGPGLRPGLATVELIVDYLAAPGEQAPAVVDAEALNTLATVEAWWQQVRRPCVLTPHVGELIKLITAAGDAFESVPDAEALRLDDAVRARVAILAAAAWGQVVVLKGARTIVAGGAAPASGGGTARAMVAPFTNPALGTAGTGDVLAGERRHLDPPLGHLHRHRGRVIPHAGGELGAYTHANGSGGLGEEEEEEVIGGGCLSPGPNPLTPRVVHRAGGRVSVVNAHVAVVSSQVHSDFSDLSLISLISL